MDYSDKSNIVMTGFISTGKSVIGRRVAELAGRPMFEIDFMIEQASGKSRSEIFEDGGESLFRKIETEQIRSIADKENVIISCGGGVVTVPENIELLRKKGVIVLLHAEIETILKRLSRQKNRPIVDAPDREQRIRNLYNERKQLYYDAADIIIDTKNNDIDTIAHKIITALLHAGLQLEHS